MSEQVNESKNPDEAHVNVSLIISGFEPIHPFKLVKKAHNHLDE